MTKATCWQVTQCKQECLYLNGISRKKLERLEISNINIFKLQPPKLKNVDGEKGCAYACIDLENWSERKRAGVNEREREREREKERKISRKTKEKS